MAAATGVPLAWAHNARPKATQRGCGCAHLEPALLPGISLPTCGKMLIRALSPMWYPYFSAPRAARAQEQQHKQRSKQRQQCAAGSASNAAKYSRPAASRLAGRQARRPVGCSWPTYAASVCQPFSVFLALAASGWCAIFQVMPPAGGGGQGGHEASKEAVDQPPLGFGHSRQSSFNAGRWRHSALAPCSSGHHPLGPPHSPLSLTAWW